MDMRRCIAIITNLDIAIKPSILSKDVISLSILKLHRICAFWNKFNKFKWRPARVGIKEEQIIQHSREFHFPSGYFVKWQIPNIWKALSNSRP